MGTMLATDRGCFTFLLTGVLHDPLVALKLCRDNLAPGHTNLSVDMVSLLLVACIGLWTGKYKHLGETEIW